MHGSISSTNKACVSPLALECEAAWARMVLAFKAFVQTAIKASFNPGQPRVPAGNSDGGQWTGSGGGGDGLVEIASSRRQTVQVRVGRSFHEATPAQSMRLANAAAWARTATNRVRTIEPSWKPQSSLTETVEGQIRALQATAREAEARYAELTRAEPNPRGIGDNQGPVLSDPATPPIRPGPPEIIEAYRYVTGMPSVPPGTQAPSSAGTVAYIDLDGTPIIGVNSDAPGYTSGDDVLARVLRSDLIDEYPDPMSKTNLGQIPNNAVFHAEANALLRAAQVSGGTLGGREIEMRTDRRLCESCDSLLPNIGLQLGNPKIRIIDGTGALWILRNGLWIRRGRP